MVSGRTARALLNCKEGALEVSLDLGLSRSRVAVRADAIGLPDGQQVAKESLAKAFSRPEDCIEISEGMPRKVYLYSQETSKYYKLYQPFDDHAPTVVINNAAMHAIVRKDPWEDEEEKVSALPPLHGRCLDTCCGLGYSAQLLARRRFERVTTCEVDPNVLKIAAVNPWSRGLFEDPVIQIRRVDVRDFVRECEPAAFAAIFHDPPTVYQAGELYGEELYREFARVLSRSGALYHYVGAPGRRRGQDYAHGVMRRLRSAGFASTKRCASGVVARLR